MPLGYTDFVRPSSDGVHALHKIVVTPEDEDVVSNQIVDTYASIKRHEFSEGCGECYWCNLVRNEMHVDQNAALPEETEFEN